MAAGDDVLGRVLAAIEAGDAEGVLETLEPASEGVRKRIAPKLRARHDALRPRLLDADRLSASPQRVAATTACIATGTARTIAGLFEVTGDPIAVDPDLAGRAVAPRGREFANALVDRLLHLDRRARIFQARAWSVLRRLVQTGAAQPPHDIRYIAMMASSVSAAFWRDPDRIYHALVDDPALLDDEVWRLFELDVVSELEQQRVWGGNTRTAAENAWIRALVRLAAEGRLDRARLLDESLAALGRDFRASKIAWHGELHEALHPTPAERRQRISGYASLLSSPTPSVVRVGLAALAEIEDQVPFEVLVRAARGPLSLREKKYAVQMLRLLELALARAAAAGAGGELLCAAAHGLAHSRPDVQERTLELLERHREIIAGSVEIRSVILGFAESVAATVRGRLDDLLGFSPREPDAEPAPAPAPEPPRVPDATVHPISDIDELIEVAVVCLEGDAPAEQLERLLDGVSKLVATPDARLHAAAALKRAHQVLSAPRWPGVSSAQIAATALCAWVNGDTKLAAPIKHAADPQAPALTPRIDYYVDWRNVRLLGHRVYSFTGEAVSNRRITDDDLRAVGLPDPQAARRAAGDPVLVFDAAPGDLNPAVQWLTALYEDPNTRGYKRELMWAADRGGARWLMSRHPGRIDVFFALAATNAYVFRDDNIVYGFGDVVLERALDPQVQLGTAGWFAIGTALMVKAADLRRLAGDVVAQTIADRRLEPRGLAEAIGFLVREGAGNLRRATETLGDVSRISRVHRAGVLSLLEAMLPHIDRSAAGLHHPLELALELATDLDLWIADSDARAALAEVVEQMSRSSKAGRSAGRLLART